MGPVLPVPRSLQRLADEIDGWLELRCPERAIELLGPMLGDPEGRPAALAMRVRAFVRLGNYRDALADLAELRQTHPAFDWIELTEAWCQKRVGNLPAAIRCMERLLEKDPRSAIGHFNLGCYLALAGQRDRAVDEVTIACGLEEGYRAFARDEVDLDGLRTDERFRQLLRTGGAGGAAGDAAATADDDLDDFDDEDDEGDENDEGDARRN